jgi:hypothetical protein
MRSGMKSRRGAPSASLTAETVEGAVGGDGLGRRHGFGGLEVVVGEAEVNLTRNSGNLTRNSGFWHGRHGVGWYGRY